MILTGAFLADAAAAVDNKLNVQGGVLPDLRSVLTGWPDLCWWC